MVLALLLARSGVEVTVLEKHGDFLRDFRGDTVHPSTLWLLDEQGLGPRFAALPQRRVSTFQLPAGPGPMLTVGDLGVLRPPYNYMAMVPQWDLLNLLADEARREPAFSLRLNTEAIGFMQERGRVTGVCYRAADGTTGELRATLTVACDGRSSLARALPELRLRSFACPMDAWWFRLPRRATQQSSNTRTKALTQVVAQLVALARKMPDYPWQEALSSDDRGRRVAAYAWLYARPDADASRLLAQTLTTGHEDTDFGQYWGLQALQRCLQLADPDAQAPAGAIPSQPAA
jgi:2-polyprenyl-6-methoxyphenol hydroxylase-like FAD-dependent oxidoreductase